MIHCIGYASDIAGARIGAGDGPNVLQKSPYFSIPNLQWEEIIYPEKNKDKLTIVEKACKKLAIKVDELVTQKKFFAVIGGDHTSAIGTWSGVHHAIHTLGGGDLGLIWIDAHLDSHTDKTSHTGNRHGMPLALLLGEGERRLTHLWDNHFPKVKPENVCLIGVRNYEAEEMKLLNQLHVRIFLMEEIKQKGFTVVMKEAMTLVKKNTVKWGVSLDIDAIDPVDAPGTGLRVPDGIAGDDLCDSAKLFSKEPHFVGIEIAEFDPHRDKNHITEKLIARWLESIVAP